MPGLQGQGTGYFKSLQLCEVILGSLLNPFEPQFPRVKNKYNSQLRRMLRASVRECSERFLTPFSHLTPGLGAPHPTVPKSLGKEELLFVVHLSLSSPESGQGLYI